MFESCLELAGAVNPGGDDLVPQAGQLGGHGEDVVIPGQPAPVPRQAPRRVRPAAGHHNLASVGILHHEVGSLGDGVEQCDGFLVSYCPDSSVDYCCLGAEEVVPGGGEGGPGCQQEPGGQAELHDSHYSAGLPQITH